MLIAVRQYVKAGFVMRNVRLIYTKTGRMKFVSHLDMNRYFIRLFRLANIPIWYTEGFNQHPYISFALPLSLGFESKYEIVDFKITDDEYTNEMLLGELNKHAVPGIEFLEAFDLVLNAKYITSSVYEIAVEGSNGDLSELKEFFERKSIIALKKNKKGKFNEIEISKHISDFSMEISGDTAKITVTLPSGNDLNINPTLYFDAFTKEMGAKLDVRVMKTAVLDYLGKTFR